MRSTSTTIAILAALPSIYAISLADFQPYLTALPTACETVYTQQVAGCKNTDFTSGKGCSTACISGLQALEQPIKLACGSANVFGTTNVVNAFIASDGVKSLCPNAPAAAVQTATSSVTSSTPSPTSTSTPSTTIAPATQETTGTSTASSTTAPTFTSLVAVTTSSTSFSSSTAITSSSDSVSSASSASAAAALLSSSSSAASTPAFILTSSASAPTASSTTGSASAQAAQNINNSGGGSPFDTTSMATGLTTSSAYPFALFLSALLAAYIL